MKLEDTVLVAEGEHKSIPAHSQSPSDFEPWDLLSAYDLEFVLHLSSDCQLPLWLTPFSWSGSPPGLIFSYSFGFFLSPH
jgi:hypothetical protein